MYSQTRERAAYAHLYMYMHMQWNSEKYVTIPSFMSNKALTGAFHLFQLGYQESTW